MNEIAYPWLCVPCPTCGAHANAPCIDLNDGFEAMLSHGQRCAAGTRLARQLDSEDKS